MISPLLCFCLSLATSGQPDPFAQEIQKLLPTPGVTLLEPGVEGLSPSGPSDLIESVRTPGLLRVTVKRPGVNAYEAEVGARTSLVEIKEGDVVFAAFEVRCPQGGRETGEGTFSLYAQQSEAPWQGIGSSSSSLGREWRRLFFSARATRGYQKGGFMLTFHIAQQPQILEFRNFLCLNLGQGVDVAKLPYNRVTYSGQELSAPWRKKADAMIELNRKAPLRVAVRRNGKPVRGATVEIKLKKHEYPFATFLDYNPMANDSVAIKYRELVPKLFNRVTVPIYWADWGWESEQERKSYFERFEWSKKQGLPMKAHNLVWPSFNFSPTRLQALRNDPPALRKTIVEEARQRAQILKSQPFVNVDVLNELKTERDFANIVGQSLYLDIFNIAKEAWPKAELVYNDYDVFEGGGSNKGSRDIVKGIIRRLQADKVPLTMIGWQGHFGESLTPPETVWRLIDEFKEFGLPLEITEFDVETRDERSQADYTRDLLTAWFAHPSTAGFTMWGFYEGKHWKPLGAMFRMDWSEKPMVREWVRLTQEVWTTKAKGSSSTQGEAAFRGFRGDYEVKVSVRGKSKTVTGRLSGKGTRLVVEAP